MEKQNEMIVTLTVEELQEFMKNCVREVLTEELPNITATPQQEFMTSQEAAEYLGLTIQTVYQLTSKKVLPHSHKGKRNYYSRVELNDYIRSGKRKTHQEIMDEVDSNY